MTRRCIKLYPSPTGAGILDAAFNRDNHERKSRGLMPLSMSEWALSRLLLGDLTSPLHSTDPAAPRTDHAASVAAEYGQGFAMERERRWLTPPRKEV